MIEAQESSFEELMYRVTNFKSRPFTQVFAQVKLAKHAEYVETTNSACQKY